MTTRPPDWLPLIAWLRTQIGHDERVAQDMGSTDWRWLGSTLVDRDVDGWRSAPDKAVLVTFGGTREYLGAHIALWDPERALAEVTVRRKRLAVVESALADDPTDQTARWLLQLEAAPYARRPGYLDVAALAQGPT